MVLYSKHPYYRAKLSNFPGIIYSTPGFGSGHKFHQLYIPMETTKPKEEWETVKKVDGIDQQGRKCEGYACKINYLIGSGSKKDEVAGEEMKNEVQDEASLDQEKINEILKHPVKITAEEYKKLPTPTAEEVQIAEAAAEQAMKKEQKESKGKGKGKGKTTRPRFVD